MDHSHTFSVTDMCRKLAMTFIRPTALPYAHLFDVDACSKFVSDYIFYKV